MKKILFIGMFLLGSTALAKHYGNAGCGLGSIVMGDDPGFKQVFASTTNGTSGSQTFGITTGSSNCMDEGAARGAKAVPMFIEVNTLALAKDAARGEGETLAGLANLMGCNSKSLGSAMKQNYNSIFVDSKMDPAAVEAGINQVITKNSQACGA